MMEGRVRDNIGVVREKIMGGLGKLLTKYEKILGDDEKIKRNIREIW